MKGYIACQEPDRKGSYAVYMQGCTLRCVTCTCPQLWEKGSEGTEAADVAERAAAAGARELRVTGGEPLAQAGFVTELFRLARDKGMTTCLETPGSRAPEELEELLALTDRAVLSLKQGSEASCRRYTGGSLVWVRKVLEALDRRKVPTDVTEVLVPGLNDSPENARFLRELQEDHPCIRSLTLLDFRQEGMRNYEELGLTYPLKAYRPTNPADHLRMESYR